MDIVYFILLYQLMQCQMIMSDELGHV